MGTEPGYGRDELSRTLRQLRADAGLSGIDAAQRVGFSQPTISRWERGLFVPSPEDVATLARVYGASAAVTRRLVQMAEDLRAEFTSARLVMHRGAFDIYDRRAAIVGTWTATVLLTDQRDVNRYLNLFQELQNLATFGDATTEILTRIADDYRALQP